MTAAAALVDAGPIVAVLDDTDRYHDECVAALQSVARPLVTVWPALTEAMHLLGFSGRAQDALLDMLIGGDIVVAPLEARDVSRIQELMRKYRDRHIDFADAALVRVAERDGFRTILTTDRSDFAVYRIHGTNRFTILP